MAERLSLQFRRLLEERKLQRIQPKRDIIAKEIAPAEYQQIVSLSNMKTRPMALGLAFLGDGDDFSNAS